MHASRPLPALPAVVDHRGVVAACAAPSALVDAGLNVLDANDEFASTFGPRAGGRIASLLGEHGDAADAASLAQRGGLELAAHAGGLLHLRALATGGPWLAQWVVACGDEGEEQRQLQMFADTVAHDLRAPLRSIDSFAKLLEDRSAAKLDAAERMHLSRIRAAATRMGSLLSALGELSRAASAGMQAQPVDISLLAEWVAAELQDAESTRGIEVSVQPGLLAMGDERLLKQLLHELVRNAWTFTRGCDAARIDVTGEHVGERLHVHVRDSGCGFDTQYSHKLFQPFQRLHSVAEGSGNGLGLAIAQRIARRHGGAVSAQSTPGVGSTFTIDLPDIAGAEGT